MKRRTRNVSIALVALVFVAALIYFLRQRDTALNNQIASSMEVAAAGTSSSPSAPLEFQSRVETTEPAPMHREPSNNHVEPESMDYAVQSTRALALSNAVERAMSFGRVFAMWIDADRAAATDYLRNMPRGNEFTAGLLMILEVMANDDPQGAVALAIELAVHPEEQYVFGVLFEQIARADRQRALDLLELLDTPARRENALRAIASRWVDDDPPAALAWALKQKESAGQSVAIEAVLFPMVSTDPWRALSLAAKHLDEDALERTVTRVLAEVTVDSPDRAAKVLAVIPEGETRSHAVLGIARELAESRPRSAINWANKIDERELREDAVRNVMEKWFAQHPEEARNYAEKKLQGDEQSQAIAHMAERWANEDPAAATAWAQTLVEPDARNAALVFAASGWARKDPPAATGWALALPDHESGRAEAIDGALSYWALIDATGAADYAERLPPGLNRDTSLDALSVLMAVQFTERAAGLALQIQDPASRADAARYVADVWRNTDPARADELLRNAGANE